MNKHHTCTALALVEPRDTDLRWPNAVTAPCSVISESSPRPLTPRYCSGDATSFGKEYDEDILQIIHAHLEVDPYHSMAYIGPMKGDLVSRVQEHFCLVTPITVLIPGGVTYRDICGTSRRLALKIASTGAEEFFTQASGNSPEHKRRFDRILVYNSVQDLNDFETTFTQMKKCLNKSGKILILHRPSSMSTLPYFQKARQVLSNTEIPFMKIITALQRTGCEVQWDLQHVQIRMPKMRWVEMLRNRFPAEIEIMSDREIEDGIRELLDGPLNYLTPVMELEDRLIIITGTPPEEPGKFTSVQRIVARPMLPYSELLDVEYTLTLTDKMKELL